MPVFRTERRRNQETGCTYPRLVPSTAMVNQIYFYCVEGPGHPQTLFLFNDDKQGRRRCKLVRRADEVRMLRAGQRYRQFRDDMKQLRAIDLKEKRILMALAEVRAVRYQ